MFGFGIIKVNKIMKIAKYFDLLDFQDTKDLTEVKAIIGVFELDNIPLKCIIRVPENSDFLNLNNTDETIVVNIKKTQKLLLSKKPQCDIEIEVYGKTINTLIELASKEGESLYIVPKDEKSNDIEFVLNDNDHNHINFSIKKYNVDDIRVRIKEILKSKV